MNRDAHYSFYSSTALPKMLASLGQHYNFQYVPTQSAQPTQSHYYTQAPQDPNAAPQSTSGLIYSNQPYVPPFQPIAASKDSSHYQTQYLSSSAPQTFPSAYAGQPDYSSVYQPQTSFSGSSVSHPFFMKLFYCLEINIKSN